MVNEYAFSDTRRTDGCYVTFERIEEFDHDATPRDYLFQDAEYRDADQARLDDWQSDQWHFIGIRAKAHIEIVLGGTAITHTIISGGLWAIESDSDEAYLAEVYHDEIEQLKAHIAALASPIYKTV